MQSCKICIFHPEPPPNLSKDSARREEDKMQSCKICNFVPRRQLFYLPNIHGRSRQGVLLRPCSSVLTVLLSAA